jgi:hypothetical protein
LSKIQRHKYSDCTAGDKDAGLLSKKLNLLAKIELFLPNLNLHLEGIEFKVVLQNISCTLINRYCRITQKWHGK